MFFWNTFFKNKAYVENKRKFEENSVKFAK